MSYDTTTHYSNNFAKTELDPKGLASPQQAINLHLLANNILEPARKHFGDRPLHISGPLGGFRTLAQQTELYEADLAAHGGIPSGLVARPGYGQHEWGKAADNFIEGVPHRELAEFYCTLPTVGGVGIYDWGVHVDERPRDGGEIAKWGLW